MKGSGEMREKSLGSKNGQKRQGVLEIWLTQWKFKETTDIYGETEKITKGQTRNHL